MNPTELLSALHTAERLKDTTRHCCTSRRRPESVAGHSWRIALMAYWMRDEFPEADMDKVIRMCLIHDLGECFTGDIPTFRKTAADEADEERQLLAWVDTLPAPYDAQMRALYREMAALETTEARIYKALDKFEAVIQHNESPIDTWEPREYDLNRTYAQENAAFSPYLTACARPSARRPRTRSPPENRKGAPLHPSAGETAASRKKHPFGRKRQRDASVCQKRRLTSAFGKEDRYERNPSGVSFVFNHRIFRTFMKVLKMLFSFDLFWGDTWAPCPPHIGGCPGCCSGRPAPAPPAGGRRPRRPC